jgi:hypothetical protein
MEPEGSLLFSQEPSTGLYPESNSVRLPVTEVFSKDPSKFVTCCYLRRVLNPPHSAHKLDDYPFSAVCDFLF